ncbi:phage baseplate assembly protein [Serratia fonticola]|uniref:phage baseplate assembly protein n=1 Tax=Serratia fonticola TaxID=47917 RepID=UPI00301C7F31
MPTQNNPEAGNAAAQQSALRDKLALLIGSTMHDDWQRYEVDADLLTPADGWMVTLGFPAGQMPAGIKAGVRVLLKVGQDTIMTGRMDTLRHSIQQGQHLLLMSGRDANAVLVDCSAPIFSASEMTLQEVITKIVKPFGITDIRIAATKPLTSKKASIEPGMTAWEALTQAAEASGLWPWTDPDGTLVIGGPDYTSPPVGTLVMLYSGQGNNMMTITHDTSIARRYSQTTVLAQKHGSADDEGQNAMRATVTDPQITLYRPKIIVTSDAQSQQEVEFRARKAQADARLAGFTLTVTVRGLRAPNGQPWSPGQRVHVVSEPHGIDAIFFLMKRNFTGGSLGVGEKTTLTLKEDGVWIPDAYPKRKKHKGKGKDDWIIVDKNTPVT